MSGEVKLPKDQLKNLDDVLDELEGKIGLPKSEEFPDMTSYLDSMGDVSTLTAEECGIQATALARYSFFLQRRYNKEVARLNWAESTLNQYTASHANEYIGDYKAVEERQALVVKNDSYANQLWRIRDHAKQRANRLFGLSQKIDNIVKSLIELQNTRRRS